MLCCTACIKSTAPHTHQYTESQHSSSVHLLPPLLPSRSHSKQRPMNSGPQKLPLSYSYTNTHTKRHQPNSCETNWEWNKHVNCFFIYSRVYNKFCMYSSIYYSPFFIRLANKQNHLMHFVAQKQHRPPLYTPPPTDFQDLDFFCNCSTTFLSH